MEIRYINAMLLFFAAGYVIWRRHAAKQHRQAEPQDASDAAIAVAYRKKGRYRMGVLLCSLLAMAAYINGWPRLVALFLLSGAAACQYGAWRISTTGFFATNGKGANADKEGQK